MNNIKHEILTFFDSINEFDKRLYLGDCADIFIFGHKDLIKYYPSQVFSFLKLARIYKLELNNKEFLNYIDKAREKEEKEINYFIYHTTCKGIARALKFNDKLNKLKSKNEIYEPTM